MKYYQIQDQLRPAWHKLWKMPPFVKGSMFLIVWLSFLWPAFLVGHPIVSPDTPAYLKGGNLAVEYLDSLFGMNHSYVKSSTANKQTERDKSQPKAVSKTITSWKGSAAYLIPADAVGIRSAYYGLFARILQNPNLWLVIAAQSLIVLYAIRRFLSAFSNFGFRAFITISLLMATATSLPWFVSYVMPDMLSGVAILLLSVLLLQPHPHKLWEILVDSALILFCLTSHTSNLLLALSLLILTIIVAGFAMRKAPFARTIFRRTGIFGAIIFCAIIADVTVSYVAFGASSLTAHTPPFLLARSIVDGPGRLYLQTHCGNNKPSYFVCRDLHNLPDKVNDFLWSPHGVYMSATPQQRAQIRAEQMTIVLHATLAHPWLQLRASFKNALVNLLTFDLRGVRADLIWHNDKHEYWATQQQLSKTTVVTRRVSTILIYASTIIALGALIGLAFKFGQAAFPPYVLFILIALLGNAAITGILSSGSSRYQARVIWLLPLTAIVSIVGTQKRLGSSSSHRAYIASRSPTPSASA